MVSIAQKTSGKRSGGDALPPELRGYLRAFVGRQRTVALLKAAGWAAAFVLAWVLVACVADRLLQLPGVVRASLLLLGAGGAVAIVARPMLRMFARVDYDEAAARVERVNPVFGERLRTVVSQAAGGSRDATSSDMVGMLTEGVMREVEGDRPGRWVRWSAAMPGWAAAGAVLLTIVLVGLIPTMEMPLLVRRLALPMGDVPAVTTTRIGVRPGSVRVNHGTPLEIRAGVERLSRGGVDILTSEDGATWSRAPMLPVKEDEYVFSVAGVDRDFQYYLRGGDARTETFAVEVLRAPAVVEYQIRYEYPLYTERGPVSVSSNDGMIDAVVGTRVRVQVVATEPLQSAVLHFGNERKLMDVGADARLAGAQIVIERSQKADLELTSKGGLTSGRIANALTIHAVADREPIVRVLQPLDDLRLHPRDLVGIGYQAMDDYGVFYLAAVVQTNSGTTREFPIRRRGDLRRQEGEFLLDLATLNVAMGDVVAVSLAAQDGLGRRVQTESRNILVSPRSIDINTHVRIAELREAARVAGLVRDELRGALTGFERARRIAARSDTEHFGARTNAGGSLANALENSLLLRQALLRAVAKSGSAAQTNALAHYVDRAGALLARVERLTALDAAGETDAAIVRELRVSREPSERLASELQTLGEAEQAAAILAERANLRTPSTRPADRAAAERLAETLRRAEQEIAAAVKELGLDAASAGLEQELRRKVEAGTRLSKDVKAIEFGPAAEAWVRQLRRSADPLAPLAERLAAAAAVEAVRPDANPVVARDLQLASRATSRLMQSMLSWPEADRVFIPHPIDEYPMALRDVQREHVAMRGEVGAGPASAERQHAARDAAAARAKLAEWAARVETSTGSEIAGEIPDEEELALAAGAETALREYEAAAALDRRLAEMSSASPGDAGRFEKVGAAVATVQEIDRLSTDQRNLAAQTEGLHDEERAAALAREQESVAKQIERFHSNVSGDAITAGTPSSANSRRQATEAVQRVQEQLAHMPQRLAVAQEAAAAYRTALERADQARWQAEGAEEQGRAAADRAVELADRAAREAGERSGSALAHLGVEVVERMIANLRPFEPETTRSVAVLNDQLRPAAATFAQAARGGEAPPVTRAAGRVRTAIEAAQSALSDVQARLIEEDPVVSAHWFAEAAARALAERPPDVPKAHRHQKAAAGALERAWQNSVRDLSKERLALAPGYRAILRTGPAAGSDTGVFRPLGELLPGFRQWGFMRGNGVGDGTAAVSEAESAGYQEQLRVYFETLGKAQQKQGE